MAKIKRFNEVDEMINIENDMKSKGISSSSIWVVKQLWDIEIYEVFINKTDAENYAKIKNENRYNYRRKTNKNMSDDEFNTYLKNSNYDEFGVYTLEDSIDQIVETTQNDYSRE